MDTPMIPTSIMLGMARAALLKEIAQRDPQLVLEVIAPAIRAMIDDHGRPADRVALAFAAVIEPLTPALAGAGGQCAGCLHVLEQATEPVQ